MINRVVPVVLVALYLMLSMVLGLADVFDRNVIIGFQFFIIGGGAFAEILSSMYRKPYTLYFMHGAFVFLFFFCSGISQFNNGLAWGLRFSDETFISANFVIILWLISFEIFYRAKVSKIKLKYNTKTIIDVDKEICNFKKYKLNILTFGLVILALYYISHGVNIYIGRSEWKSVFNISIPQVVSLVVASIICGVVYFHIILRTYYFKNHGGFVCFVFCLIITVLVYPPTVITRFRVAMIYGGILLVLIDLMGRKRFVFPLFIMCSLLFVFPLMNVFRNLDLESLENIPFLVNSAFANYFSRADMDAYSMLVATVEYVREYDIAYGWQILWVLLFFVPRDFVYSKAEGSGNLVVHQFDSFINNVSCPLPAEGYLNFGLIGVIVLALVFAIVARFFDEIYWKGKYRFVNILYPALLFFALFILRGDLLSSFAYIVGFVFIVGILYRFTYK